MIEDTGRPETRDNTRPRLYHEFASWWPLLSPPRHYSQEAEFFYSALSRTCDRAPATILELGSGGGNTASHLKRRARLTLVDQSSEMLAVSRELNPECEHVAGDMRSVRLTRSFDAVLAHDAIMYAVDEADLRRVLHTAFVHCRPGGAAAFAPDYVKETFRPDTRYGGQDGDLRSIRYVEWITDPDTEDTTYQLDFVYLFREGTGPVRIEHDVHVLGLFSRNDWRRLLEDVGFDPQTVTASEAGSQVWEGEVFLGRRRAATGLTP